MATAAQQAMAELARREVTRRQAGRSPGMAEAAMSGLSDLYNRVTGGIGQEVDASVGRLKTDARAYTDTRAWPGDSTPGHSSPGGERAAAADRMGGDLADTVMAVPRGALRGAGMSENDAQGAVAIGLTAMGSRAGPVGAAESDAARALPKLTAPRTVVPARTTPRALPPPPTISRPNPLSGLTAEHAELPPAGAPLASSPRYAQVPVRPLSAGRPPVDPAVAAKTAAEAKVAAVLKNAAARDQMTPQAIAAAHGQDPASLAFHTGPNMASLAETVAQSPGQGQTILRNAIEDHRGDLPNQVRGDIGATLGGSRDYLDTMTTLQAQRKAAADAGMAEFGQQPVTIDENGAKALQSDLAKGAIKKAASNALASPHPEEQAAGAALNGLHDQLAANPQPTITMPVRQAQDVSRSLLEAADSAYRSGDGATGKALKYLGRSIRDNAADPARGGDARYGEWLNAYGTSHDTQRALELGMGLFKGGLENTPPYVAKALGDLRGGAAVQEAYSKGAAEALMEQVRTSGGDIATLRKVMRDENVRDRLKMAFTDDSGYRDFVSRLEDRVRQQNLNNKVTGGSPTFLRSAANADLQAQEPSLADRLVQGIDLAHSLTSPTAIAAKGAKFALNNLPRTDRSVIGDPVTNAMLARALHDKAEMQRLLNLEPPSAPAAAPSNPLAGGGTFQPASISRPQIVNRLAGQ